MKTLRIAQAALALMLATGISSNALAFMVVTADQPTKKADLSTMVDALREEVEAGETKCEDMLAKLNSVLDEIDAKLDIGVPNEEEYLAARDAVAEMRYDLECLATRFTQVIGGGGGTGGLLSGGAPVFGGGGGGAVGGGGGSLGGLAGLAVIGGGVAAVSSNSSSPGFVASQSVSN
jgi:hypothetical protein